MNKIASRAQTVYDSWRVAPCVCKLNDGVFGDIKVPENFQSKSLNQLFSNTVMYFFSLHRSGACNAFDTFFTPMDKTGNKIKDSFISNQVKFLRNYRLEVVDANTQKLQNAVIQKAKA
jgi:hypothetical protein